MACLVEFKQNNSKSELYSKMEADFVLTIKKVNSKKLFQEFYQFPFELYEDQDYWVPPFWKEFNDFFKEKNPFWSHAKAALFIAYKNNMPVGRIAAFIDTLYCKSYQKNTGFFGYFECVDDESIAQTLFQTAEQWLKDRDIQVMQGPIDGRIDNGCGFLCNGFNEQQSLLSSYSKKYYYLILFRLVFDIFQIFVALC